MAPDNGTVLPGSLPQCGPTLLGAAVVVGIICLAIWSGGGAHREASAEAASFRAQRDEVMKEQRLFIAACHERGGYVLRDRFDVPTHCEVLR